MRLAVVVQRYGADINGGAELHARYIAEHLARRAEVEVLTTRARDYITWRNELPEGVESLNGVTVRRFPVARERDTTLFGRRSRVVFERSHSVRDELAWLEAEGPTSPALIRHLVDQRERFDYFIFFSYRYYHAHEGARAVASRAVLVPTAERDPAVGLAIFGPLFRGVRAIMYNSPEERAMIEAVSGNESVPGVVVGVGSAIPPRPEPGRFARKFGVDGPYVIYVGRIDENKGCPELFDFFLQYLRATRSRLTLVMAGASLLPIPSHPRIRHVGYLDDADKFDAVAGATALVMPSYFESLSMVTLEAWALGRPVLANGRCDVLKGQCLRSNGGLFYEDGREFVETLWTLESNRPVAAALGRRGREFFARHYAWPVVESKYFDMFERLAGDDRAARVAPAMAPLPGWLARRRRTLPPARQVIDALPAGPALDRQPRQGGV